MRNEMEYRAVVFYQDGWWVGWLIDIPGVNAQEKTKEELLSALNIGALEYISTHGYIPEEASVDNVIL